MKMVHEQTTHSQQDDHFTQWYSADAAKYDRRFTESPRARLFADAERKLLVQLIGARRGHRILDVGTGTGRAALAYAAHEAEVTACDLTYAMMQQANTKARANGVTVDMSQANARALPFADKTFDATSCIRMLHLFPVRDYPLYIAELRRVTRPGGIVLIEFDSLLAGAIVGAPREVVRRATGSKYRHYVMPYHINGLFADFASVELHGFWFPGIGRLATLHPAMQPVLRAAHLSGKLGFLGNNLLVRATLRQE